MAACSGVNGLLTIRSEDFIMTLVYTIGYEGTDIDRFIQTLKAAGVKVLADVRAVALSRKKGFSKTALRARLQQEGIAYLHFNALGDPKPGREAARAGRFSEFRTIYAAHLAGQPAQAALAALSRAVENTSACLLCFERDPKECHRSIIAGKLKAAGMDVFHLFGDSPARNVDFATKLPRHHSRQGASAA